MQLRKGAPNRIAGEGFQAGDLKIPAAPRTSGAINFELCTAKWHLTSTFQRGGTPPYGNGGTCGAVVVAPPGQCGAAAKLGFGEGARGGAAAGRGSGGGELGGGKWASPADLLREHDDDSGGESRARVRFGEH